MIAKFVLGDKILPKIMDHIAKVYKLDKVLNYMELPNDADNRIDKLEEQHIVELMMQIEAIYEQKYGENKADKLVL